MSSTSFSDLDPFWAFSIRLLVALVVQFIVVRLIYYRYSKREGRVFTFMQMGLMIFLVCVLLKSVELQLGMALGLFAIFAIMRFRSSNLSLRDMTYFFTVIGISVINAMASWEAPVRGMLTVNGIIILSVFLLEIFSTEMTLQLQPLCTTGLTCCSLPGSRNFSRTCLNEPGRRLKKWR